MKVEMEEIVFIKQNEPQGFARLIVESLAERGIIVNRTAVYIEISTLKSNYNEVIINEARRLLKAVKGLEFNKQILNKILE